MGAYVADRGDASYLIFLALVLRLERINPGSSLDQIV